MAKIFKSLLSAFLAVFMVVSLMAVPSSAISISKSSVTLTKGYQTTLSVSGTSKTVTWSTGDKSIATVTSKGKVVGKAPGSTYIYAKVGGNTLKCKVTVVAAKISSSTSRIVFDKKGQTKTITVTIKGSHSGVTAGTTNKKVASASWVKPVSWDGNDVKLKVTAQGEGTARIKVYLKNYSSSCYKYIDIQVGDDDDDDYNNNNNNNNNNNSSNNSISIVPISRTLSVAAGGTQTLQVYCTNQANMAYSLSDSTVASVTPATNYNENRNFTIKGLKGGNTTLRFYDKNNTKYYVDVVITVVNSEYYTVYSTTPTKQLQSDRIVQIPYSNMTYYMLAPYNYDPALVNTAAAQYFNYYPYYQVYTKIPSRQAASDTYKEFLNSNTSYTYGSRYVLLPANYDEVEYNTVKAQYNNYFEYWTVYSKEPTKPNQWDYLIQWQLTDPKTGKYYDRYMIVPYNDYDTDRIDEIKNKDISNNSAYQQYVVYTNMPNVNSSTDVVVNFRYNNQDRWLVVPRSNTLAGYAKANDTIYNYTKLYEYNVVYTTRPTAGDGEEVRDFVNGNTTYYVLLKKDENNTSAGSVYNYQNYANGIKEG